MGSSRYVCVRTYVRSFGVASSARSRSFDVVLSARTYALGARRSFGVALSARSSFPVAVSARSTSMMQGGARDVWWVPLDVRTFDNQTLFHIYRRHAQLGTMRGREAAPRTSAANRLIGEVVQIQRRPLLGPSSG